MRVTFLLPCYPVAPTGGFRAVYEYANHLVSRGHEVAVVHARATRHTPQSKASGMIDLARRAKKRLAEFVREPAIDWQWIDHRVRLLFVPDDDPRSLPDGDAVFATSWQTVSCILEAAFEKGAKCYLLQHYETWEAPKEVIDATWRTPLHKVAIARWLVDIGKGLGCREVTYIPYGMDHARYTLSSPIENRACRVAMMFSHMSFKRSADGIAAMELARSRHPELTAILFGTPRRPNELADWIEYHQNPPQDFIVGNIYNGSSIFVCPSLSEGFFLPGAEAACCGCAVVSTDNGGTREYIEHGVTGLLSPPGNPEALARNICRLLEDEPLRRSLAAACNAYVSRLSWVESSLHLEQFIVNAVNRRDVPERRPQPA